MLLTDRTSLSTDRQYTDEGFLIVPARIARTGIQEYYAVEMGLTDRKPNDVIRVYRPEDEVFKPESLQSFANKPVTDNHPSEMITSKNAKQYIVGFSGDNVYKDGMFAKTMLNITDDSVIKKIEDGKVELSNGYTSDIEWTKGISPDGESYDAIQTNIRGNHIALVDRGRCGTACRLSDNLNQEEPKSMSNETTVLIDGVTYEATSQVAQAVGKLQGQLKDAEKAKGDAEEEAMKAKADMEEAEKENQKKMDSLQAKLDDALSKVPGPEMLDQLVDNRIATRDTALKLINDFDWKGKDCETIRKEVVALKCESVDVDKVSVDYIRSRFDALAESFNNNSQHQLDDALRGTVKPTENHDNRPADVIARERMQQEARDAWKKGDK